MRIYLFHLPFSSSSFLVKRIGRKKKLNAGLGEKKILSFQHFFDEEIENERNKIYVPECPFSS